MHHLFLPDDDAAALLQSPPLQRVGVVPRDAVAVALHELAHDAAPVSGAGQALHPGTGPDQRHLVGQVPQVAGFESFPHLELGRRLEQEHALGLALADQAVDLRVFRVDARDVGAASLALFDKVKGLFNLVQYRQGEQVDLGETCVGTLSLFQSRM